MPTLQVTVVSGKDLAVRDRDTSDPYVKLRVGYAQQWHKTRVQKNNLNPVFNENFKLHVDNPDEQNLDIEVWDSDLISRDDFMGRGSVRIEHLTRNKPTKLEIPLKETESGSITVILTAEDFGN